ncbi:hypothetical protein [Salininema proteolyticum]|uniref:Uncharacterized protein n=1 Tax=Salininema proteolyticum TaxID=1607685 RepID=A0ABV8TV43_9ACTN
MAIEQDYLSAYGSIEGFDDVNDAVEYAFKRALTKTYLDHAFKVITGFAEGNQSIALIPDASQQIFDVEGFSPDIPEFDYEAHGIGYRGEDDDSEDARRVNLDDECRFVAFIKAGKNVLNYRNFDCICNFKEVFEAVDHAALDIALHCLSQVKLYHPESLWRLQEAEEQFRDYARILGAAGADGDDTMTTDIIQVENRLSDWEGDDADEFRRNWLDSARNAPIVHRNIAISMMALAALQKSHIMAVRMTYSSVLESAIEKTEEETERTTVSLKKDEWAGVALAIDGALIAGTIVSGGSLATVLTAAKFLASSTSYIGSGKKEIQTYTLASEDPNEIVRSVLHDMESLKSQITQGEYKIESEAKDLEGLVDETKKRDLELYEFGA